MRQLACETMWDQRMKKRRERDQRYVGEKPPRAYDVVKSDLMDGAKIKGKPPRARTLKKTCSLMKVSPQELTPCKGRP